MATTNIPTLKELMAVGAHFGHKRERSHPKAQQYIYILREGIYIIDLQKTQEGLEKALKQLSDLAGAGKTVLFVGTKPQAADLVKRAAERALMPYIVHHWPGGLLTNFETITNSLKQLEQMEQKLAAPEAINLTKKEKRVLSDKIRKTNTVLGGVRQMKRLPDALFVVDVVAEATAVGEAYTLGIPVIGLTDTNANPEKVDFPIPANDDARKAIELITSLAAEALAGNRPVAVSPTEEPKTAKVASETVEEKENSEKPEASAEAPAKAKLKAKAKPKTKTT